MIKIKLNARADQFFKMRLIHTIATKLAKNPTNPHFFICQSPIIQRRFNKLNSNMIGLASKNVTDFRNVKIKPPTSMIQTVVISAGRFLVFFFVNILTKKLITINVTKRIKKPPSIAFGIRLNIIFYNKQLFRLKQPCTKIKLNFCKKTCNEIALHVNRFSAKND